jgi:nitrogen fixation NifU-like protein
VSPELIDHFRNPRNVGELPPPAITVEVSNPICGDILRLSVLVESTSIEGASIARALIKDARYKVRGCTASIASGSALTELLVGKKMEVVKSLKRTDVEKAVGGLSNESKHAAQLCEDALTAIAAKLRQQIQNFDI